MLLNIMYIPLSLLVLLYFVSLKCKLLYIYTGFNILWFKNLYDKLSCFIAVKKDLFCKQNILVKKNKLLFLIIASPLLLTFLNCYVQIYIYLNC